MESEIFGHERGAFTGAAERRIGCFELADGGTLLLDEIGEMPAPTQAKLLRVLEDHKVRGSAARWKRRWTCACWPPPTRIPNRRCSEGQLRQDLYFRLNVFHIHLPPLRDHKEDLPAARRAPARGNLRETRAASVRGVGADVLELFKSYPWPGNVRELRNVLERAAIACDRGTIGRSHLPSGFRPRLCDGIRRWAGRHPLPPGHHRGRRRTRTDPADSGGHQQNKTRAAELLGISLKTLHNKLKEYEAGRSDASQPEN